MNTISIYEPAGCCATSSAVVNEQALIFNADLDWCKEQGINVERFNLLKQPKAFLKNELVKGFLNASGEQSLPLVLVNGQVVLTGRLPVRKELMAWVGLSLNNEPKLTSSCCK